VKEECKLKDHVTDRDIKFLDRNPPQFAEDEARRIARELFGLSGDFEPLKSERDQNFHIRTEEGEGYVLKLSNADEDPGVVDFQVRALMHIERQDPALPIPRVVGAKDGAVLVTVRDGRGIQHIARVLTYLPGTLLYDVPMTLALWRNVGKVAGRLDLALRGFFHPHARQEHPWDITRCAALRPHTHHIADATARRNSEEILDYMARDVIPRLRGLRHQVIHADVHSKNTLVDPDRPDRITGILDFGDMVFAPLVAEVAIAADVEGVPSDDLIETICAVVAGFDDVLPLQEEEIDLVYDLVLARLAVTATIIAWRKEMRPDQPEYIHESEVPCWGTIEDLRIMGRAQVRAGLRRACRFPPYCPVVRVVDAAAWAGARAADDAPDAAGELLARRRRVLGARLQLFYQKPLHFERGSGPWLYGPSGEAFLDAYNNVPVVGHCHPHVVKAVTRQTAALNTNTRYLYGSIVEYAERLAGTLPGDLSVCIFVNSGSEANDIAWRIAQFTSGQRGALVMEDAYHGITEAIAELTPSNLKRELAPHVQTLISPDPYRGRYRYGEPDLSGRYAQDAERAIADLARVGFRPAAFMVDTALVSNGIPDVPEGYLAAVSEKVRQTGGLVIADEVQAGFGRFGTHMWGHLVHGLRPDIVTIGKPVGNGYPLGVIVTRPEILDAFGEETGLFSTFGGNTVACAAGLAVLDVIEGEGLLKNAQLTGDYLRDGIRALAARHDWIGDVRGRGLLAGVELVRDRDTLEPAGAETNRVLDLMRQNGVLVGREGPHDNVIKIRPPLVFQRQHADILIEGLDKSLAAL
jgi:4-aminobutyrate aminotransferase-like enzyme/Ser/Thr protein kinase RdoA (MazF antagonist)